MGHMITSQAGRAIDLAAKRAAVMQWYGIGPTLVDQLMVLLGAKGEWVTIDTMAANSGMKPNAIYVRICRLREVMDAEAIDHKPAQGYRLTEVGLNEIREAMAEMARSLVA